MSQDVTIAGSSYEDVPSIDVPTTGGGTSSFFDVSDTTATAADVASGKVFYAADGVQTVGTASGGSGVSVFYGTCSTAAATAAKAVVCEEFTSADLVEGTVVNVKFTYAQTYNGAPTLNVQSTGAKNVKRIGTTNAARYEWQAGEVLQFVYDGTYWMLTDGGIATTTYYGVTKLSSATNSTSNALAATASAVKAAYDLADGKQDALVSGTNIKTINGASILGSGDITTPTYTLPTASTSTLGGVKVDGSTITIADGVISSCSGGVTGGMTVRGARVIIPKRTSSAQDSTVVVSGLGGVDAHDIVLFFGTAGYYIRPFGFIGGSYRVNAGGANKSAFDAFAAIISPNYEVGSQASIVGSNASLCNTTTPLVGDTVTITATSGAMFTVYDAASGGAYASSNKVAAGGTYSFTVECATSYIAAIASGGGSND